MPHHRAATCAVLERLRRLKLGNAPPQRLRTLRDREVHGRRQQPRRPTGDTVGTADTSFLRGMPRWSVARQLGRTTRWPVARDRVGGARNSREVPV
jgi:hypothetical protein